ncbi:DUF992 domain-containing protein [Hansschlegelia beijingensis]|uniref:DUF992 domain-containing protein n=1 Tax=Hansschlegelia beijingensis TaxID=1133344 RepID=UPI00387EEFF3
MKSKSTMAARAAVLDMVGLLMAISAATPASAQSSVKIGLLTCTTGPQIGEIVFSKAKTRCTFHPDVGEDENYHGEIRKYGLDVGVEARSVIVWAVFSPQTGYAPGSLAGVYVGATADATIGVGLGANVLVGGSNKQFALQPLSLQTQAGFNIAVGVGELVLTER